MTLDPAPAESTTETVAVVLSGAAARGAFQAGALAELVPALDREGLKPTIWLGTSAGGINAALWGARAHLGPDVAGEQVLEVWRRMNDDHVYRPLPWSLARSGVQYVAGAVLCAGTGATSVLDTAPLRRTAETELDERRLEVNVSDGRLDAVGVVATRMPAEPDNAVGGTASGRSVLFLDEHTPGNYSGQPRRALDVVRGPITPDHVLASSAIPVAFSPVKVTRPARAAGWYLDGGVRLNTPLHPAVGLGATRIVVVSATATTYGEPPRSQQSGEMPDVADAAAQVLNAALADRTTEDLAALRRRNAMVAQVTEIGRPDLLTGSTGEPYRVLEFLEVSPPPGEMGRLAADVFGRRTRGLGRLTELDNWVLGQALRGAGDGVGRSELLSYLFFDEEYFAESIELGRKTAAAALARGWQR